MDKKTWIGITCGVIIIGFIFYLMGCFVAKFKENKNSSILKRDGIVVAILGVITLVIFLTFPSFQSLPNQSVMVSIANFFSYRIQVPWGSSCVTVTVILASMAYLFCRAGIEEWKYRQDYFRFGLCCIFGLIIFLEAIFQWH